MRGVIVIVLLGLFVWSLLGTRARAQSIGGVDCVTIRKLTYPERKYWIWRLGLSQEQIKQIRKACHIK